MGNTSPKYNWPLKDQPNENIENIFSFEQFNAYTRFLSNFKASPIGGNFNCLNTATATATSSSSKEQSIDKSSIPRTNVKRKYTNIEVSNDKVDVGDIRKGINKNSLSAAEPKTKNKTHKRVNKNIMVDDDSISIPTQSDIEDKINNLLEDTESDSEDDSSEEEELDIDSIKHQYLDEELKGPPLDQKLASLFNAMKEHGMPKDKVAAKSKEHPMPENCNMETKQVNPEIWGQAMSARDRSLDLQIQKSQKLASKAAYSVLKIAESAMTSKGKKDRKTALK